MGEPQSMRTIYRTDKSLYMSILQHLIRPLKNIPGLIKPAKTYPGESLQLKIPKYARQCHVQERQVEGVYIYDLTSVAARPIVPPATKTKVSGDIDGKVPAIDSSPDSKVHRIYYFAGGSFRSPPSSQHWKFLTGVVTKFPHAVVSVISPPLAPKSTAPKCFPQLLRMYRELMREAAENKQRITFAGDSSGGNLAIALTLEALKEGPMYAPDAVLMISPAVDSAKRNPKMWKLEPSDPVLSVGFTRKVTEGWRGDWPASDPRVSPLHADLMILRDRGIKVFAVTGGNDILTPDALLFRDKCVDAGVEGEWLHWEGQMHCFPLAFMYGLRESREGYEWIVSKLDKIGKGEWK